MSETILDNINFVRESFLHFKSNDDMYMISILQRKKDHPEASANENERMLANFYIKNIEYFDKKIDLLKEYCHNFKARCYIKPQVRSIKAVNRLLLRFLAMQIDNWDLNYSTLTREIISGYHDSRNKKVVLDLDDISQIDAFRIKNFVRGIVKQDRDGVLEKETDVYLLPTFNGYHIITPGFDPRGLQNFPLIKQKNINVKDIWKSDADTIVYAVK